MVDIPYRGALCYHVVNNNYFTFLVEKMLQAVFIHFLFAENQYEDKVNEPKASDCLCLDDKQNSSRIVELLDVNEDTL